MCGGQEEAEKFRWRSLLLHEQLINSFRCQFSSLSFLHMDNNYEVNGRNWSANLVTIR